MIPDRALLVIAAGRLRLPQWVRSGCRRDLPGAALARPVLLQNRPPEARTIRRHVLSMHASRQGYRPSSRQRMLVLGWSRSVTVNFGRLPGEADL